MVAWRGRGSIRRASLDLIGYAPGARTLQRPRRLWLRLHGRRGGGSRLPLPAVWCRPAVWCCSSSSFKGPPRCSHLRTLLLGCWCCASGRIFWTTLYHALDIPSKNLSGSSTTGYAETLLPALPLTAFALTSLLGPPELPEAVSLFVIVGVEVYAQGTVDTIRELAPGAEPLVRSCPCSLNPHAGLGARKEAVATAAGPAPT